MSDAKRKRGASAARVARLDARIAALEATRRTAAADVAVRERRAAKRGRDHAAYRLGGALLADPAAFGTTRERVLEVAARIVANAGARRALGLPPVTGDGAGGGAG